MGEFCNNLKITLLTFSSHFVRNFYKSDNQVVVAAIYRYKMCSLQNVNTLGGPRNKLPSKITEVSVTKPNYAELDF